MGSRSFSFQVLLRLVLLAANCYGITYVLSLQGYWFSLWNLVILLALQLFFFFRYLTRWQRDLRVFSSSVKHNDYTITYNLVTKSDPNYELYAMLNDITRYVRDVNSRYEEQNLYFQYVVEQAQVGLIAYDTSGSIVLCNDEARRLLGAGHVKNIREIERYDRKLYDDLVGLALNQPRLVHTRHRAKLSARCSRFVVDTRNITLLSLLNIRTELEENEMRSWQELISVLTHEIMNSITPIHSLNGSMAKYLDRIQGNDDTVARARSSLQVINRRSQALMDFVDRYRKISTVPLPHLQHVGAGAVITPVLALLQEELAGIVVTVSHNDVRLRVDPSQFEQILINLLKNAIHAMEGTGAKTIHIEVVDDKNTAQASAPHAARTLIHIQDSGKGIAPDLIEKIFIPFFTTRPGGSGIGLTLSRQIMQRHGGTIEVQSEMGKGTKFTLMFPGFA